MRRSPSNGSMLALTSATIRAAIAPTVTHAMRITIVTAVFEVWTWSHATWSSNALVWRAS
jgi:hypothetical protein